MDVSFMGIREGAKGLISARWGVYPPGRTCSMDSALPTWNRPGALESRCGGSSVFSRTSARYQGDKGGHREEAQGHRESRPRQEALRGCQGPRRVHVFGNEGDE